MSKTHSQTRIIDNKGNARIATYCAYHIPQLTWRKIVDDDIGLDGEIEIYDANYHPLAEIIKVQLKSSEKDKGYIKNESAKDDKFTFYAEKSHVDYWQRLPFDVLLIVFDGRNGKSDLYAKIIENIDIAKYENDSVPIVFNKKTDLIHEKNNDFHSRFSKTLGQKSVLYEKFLPKFFIPDLRYFVGRDDLLRDIYDELDKSHRVSIHDISGLGKTYSTLEFARRYQSKYDKIFFINASKETYLESMAECGVLLEPSVAIVQEQAVKVNVFKTWLEKNDKWLVIFDNVDVAQDIFPFVPTNLKGDCFFTSNFRDVQRLGKEVSITKLDVSESKTLLFSFANGQPNLAPKFNDQTEADAFNKVIEEIDGLPISLTTTGAFIAKKAISFAEYLERLNEQPEIILEAEDDFGTYHKKSALKAFSIAFEANTDTKDLDDYQTQLAEAVKQLYFVASFIYPEDIHEEFLRSYLQNHCEPFNQSDKPTVFWQDVRAKFIEYDLFKWNRNNKTFWTHRLIQKTIQTKANKNEKEEICRNVLALLLDYFPQFDYNNKEQCEKYYQHTIIALENGDIFFETEVTHELYFRLFGHQDTLGNYDKAEFFSLRNLEISKVVFGNEAAETGTNLNNLGNVYYSQKRFDEAIKLFKMSLKIVEKTIGKNTESYAKTLDNLGKIYIEQGKGVEAMQVYVEAIEIDIKTIGMDSFDFSIRLNNFAYVFKRFKNYEKAKNIYNMALNIGEKTVGNDHPSFAHYLNNLASVYFEQNEFQKALPLFESADKILMKEIPNHPDNKIIKRNLIACQEAIEREKSET